MVRALQRTPQRPLPVAEADIQETEDDLDISVKLSTKEEIIAAIRSLKNQKGFGQVISVQSFVRQVQNLQPQYPCPFLQPSGKEKDRAIDQTESLWNVWRKEPWEPAETGVESTSRQFQARLWQRSSSNARRR